MHIDMYYDNYLRYMRTATVRAKDEAVLYMSDRDMCKYAKNMRVRRGWRIVFPRSGQGIPSSASSESRAQAVRRGHSE